MFISASGHDVQIFRLGFIRGGYESTNTEDEKLSKPSEVSPKLILVSVLERVGVDREYRGKFVDAAVF